MLTRLEVDGFKSLRGFAVDLEPFTVFIGPNGAGKSNILEALALLSRLASEPIVDAFRHGRGRPSDQFSRFGAEVAREIRFAAEFLFWGTYTPGQGVEANATSRFRYELVIERSAQPSGAERLFVRHEELQRMRPEDDTWIAERPEFAPFVAHANPGTRMFVSTENQSLMEPDLRPEDVPINRRRTFLAHAAYPARPYSASLDRLPDALHRCQWIRLDVEKFTSSSDRVDTGELQADGSNLPTILADLPPPLLGEIRADLVALVPGLSSFFVVSDGDSFRVEVELSGGERLPASLISNGTLRLLALLTALRSEPRPSLIGIEEPENGIYPGRLRALVDLLMQETQRVLHEEPNQLAKLDKDLANFPPGTPIVRDLLPTQIILTTHSPVILAALRAHPEHLRYVDMVHRDGRRITRARAVGRASKAQRHLVVSQREIDQLLDTANFEGAE